MWKKTTMMRMLRRAVRRSKGNQQEEVLRPVADLQAAAVRSESSELTALL